MNSIPRQHDDLTVDIAQARDTSTKLANAPTPPEGVAALLAAPSDDPAAVARVLEANPAFTGWMLGTINSPHFHLDHKVHSVAHAVTLLGAREARRLALAHAMMTVTSSWQIDRELANKWWFSSLRKACAARACCQRIAPDDAAEAYSIGLIQDVGLLGLISLDQAFYRRTFDGIAIEQWLDMEREHFGLNHAIVSRTLLLRWGAPRELWQPVAHHHCPTVTTPLGQSLYFASLMPHLDEAISAGTLQQLHELHEAGPTTSRESLEQLLARIDQEAALLAGRKSELAVQSPDDLLVQLQTELANEIMAGVAAGTATRKLVHQLTSEAMTDPLTGLHNRRGLLRTIEQALDQSAPNTDIAVGCAVFDIDAFKSVNDTLGHESGDTLLQAFAKLLQTNLTDAIIARLGGDEFCALWLHATPDVFRQTMRQLNQMLRTNQITVEHLPGRPLDLQVSLGAAHVQAFKPTDDINTLFRMADQLMYRCKQHHSGEPEIGTFHCIADLAAA